jgi:hypothetical protein
VLLMIVDPVGLLVATAIVIGVESVIGRSARVACWRRRLTHRVRRRR